MQHLLSITNYTPEVLQEILDLSLELEDSDAHPLKGKNILFVFEKPSLRTKVGTEAAINQLGGNVIHVDAKNVLYGDTLYPDGTSYQGREASVDTVNNIAQWCDAIFARVYDHREILKLAQYNKIPIINALCDQHHPMQALADFLTIQESYGRQKCKITFVGDANNVAFSLLEMGLKLGYAMAFTGPGCYFWNDTQLHYFSDLVQKHGGSFGADTNTALIVPGSDFIYADAFVSMGEEDDYDSKLSEFDGYQVNSELMNLAGSSAKFLHCLPAHRGEEVTNEVIDAAYSLVYQQANNRRVSAKGVFSYLLDNSKATTTSPGL